MALDGPTSCSWYETPNLFCIPKLYVFQSIFGLIVYNYLKEILAFVYKRQNFLKVVVHEIIIDQYMYNQTLG